MTFDQWVRELVNLGVPINTGLAIDNQIVKVLVKAGVKPTVRCEALHSSIEDLRAALSTEREAWATWREKEWPLSLTCNRLPRLRLSA